MEVTSLFAVVHDVELAAVGNHTSPIKVGRSKIKASKCKKLERSQSPQDAASPFPWKTVLWHEHSDWAHIAYLSL